MKTRHSFLSYGALIALTASLLLATQPVATAQTFNRQQILHEEPGQLQTNVYPLSNRFAAIKVIYINPASDKVRITIRNARGYVFYTGTNYMVDYHRSFDLSELPVGEYEVEFNRHQTRVVRSFTISEPITNRIAMSVLPQPDAPELAKPRVRQLTSNR